LPGAQYIFSVDSPLVEGQNYEVFLQGVRSEAGQVKVSSGFQTISGSTSFYDYKTLLTSSVSRSCALDTFPCNSTVLKPVAGVNGVTDVPPHEEVALTITFNGAVMAGDAGTVQIFYGGDGYTFDTIAYEMELDDPNFVINERQLQLKGLWFSAGATYKVVLPAGLLKTTRAVLPYFETIFRTLSQTPDTTPPVIVAADPFMQAVGSEGTRSDAVDYVGSLGFRIAPSTRYVYLALSEPVVATGKPAIVEVGMPGSGNLVESDYGEHTFRAVQASVAGHELVVDLGAPLEDLLAADGFSSFDNWPRRGWMLRIPSGIAADAAGNLLRRADVRFSLEIPEDPTFSTVLAEPAYLSCSADGKPDILRLDMPTLCAAQDTDASLSATSAAENCQGYCWTQTSGKIMPLSHLVPKGLSGGLKPSCHERCASAEDTLGRTDGSAPCNGYPLYGADHQPALLCLSRKECEELCIAEFGCVGFDMHKTLDRCWLNAAGGGTLKSDDEYHYVELRTCNGKDFWWPAFSEPDLETAGLLGKEELGDNAASQTCVAKCRNLQPCAGDECFCDGATDEDPAALCLPRESCEAVCAATPGCQSLLSHRSLPRCFLYSGGPDDATEGSTPEGYDFAFYSYSPEWNPCSFRVDLSFPGFFSLDALEGLFAPQQGPFAQGHIHRSSGVPAPTASAPETYTVYTKGTVYCVHDNSCFDGEDAAWMYENDKWVGYIRSQGVFLKVVEGPAGSYNWRSLFTPAASELVKVGCPPAFASVELSCREDVCPRWTACISTETIHGIYFDVLGVEVSDARGYGRPPMRFRDTCVQDLLSELERMVATPTIATLVLSLATGGWPSTTQTRQVYRDALDTTRVDLTSDPYYVVVQLESPPCDIGSSRCGSLPSDVVPAGDLLTIESLHKDCSEGPAVGLSVRIPFPVPYLLFFDIKTEKLVGAEVAGLSGDGRDWTAKLPSGSYLLVRELVPPVLLDAMPTSVATRAGPLNLRYSESVRVPADSAIVLKPEHGPLSGATLGARGAYVQLKFDAPLLAGTVYTAELALGVVTDLSNNSAVPLSLAFSTPETTYGPGSSRLRLHGVGGWKQWRIKSFELFADGACSDPYAFTFSPVDWMACYPYAGGIPSVKAAYAIGGEGPLYEAALAVTPSPTPFPTAAPTEPPPAPFTLSPTVSPTASPTPSPTETASPTPAPTYPLICVSDCRTALFNAAVSCTESPERWDAPSAPEDFGFCNAQGLGTVDSFCPEDLSDLPEDQAYFCFYANTECEERCAQAARCPNDDIIGLGYTPKLYPTDFGVDERDFAAIGGCDGFILKAKVDLGLGCKDDVSAVLPGLAAGTTLCDICCDACENTFNDYCSPAPGPKPQNPYRPPTPNPTPAPSGTPTPVPTAVPTPQPTPDDTGGLTRRLLEEALPAEPWLKVATHAREMVKAKSCYHLCFRDSISLSSCSVTGVDGSLVDIACVGPRQSVVPMQFSCSFVASTGRFSCTSVGGEPEPLIFKPLSNGAGVQVDMNVMYVSGGDAFQHRRMQSVAACDGFIFDADRVYETSTALCVPNAAACEELCTALNCGCYEFHEQRCRLGETEEACRAWADFVTPLAATCEASASASDSAHAALYMPGKGPRDIFDVQASLGMGFGTAGRDHPAILAIAPSSKELEHWSGCHDCSAEDVWVQVGTRQEVMSVRVTQVADYARDLVLDLDMSGLGHPDGTKPKLFDSVGVTDLSVTARFEVPEGECVQLNCGSIGLLMGTILRSVEAHTACECQSYCEVFFDEGCRGYSIPEWSDDHGPDGDSYHTHGPICDLIAFEEDKPWQDPVPYAEGGISAYGILAPVVSAAEHAGEAVVLSGWFYYAAAPRLKLVAGADDCGATALALEALACSGPVCATAPTQRNASALTWAVGELPAGVYRVCFCPERCSTTWADVGSFTVAGTVPAEPSYTVPLAPAILHGHMLTAMAGKKVVIPAGESVRMLAIAYFGVGCASVAADENVAESLGYGDFAFTVAEPGLYSVCVCTQNVTCTSYEEIGELTVTARVSTGATVLRNRTGYAVKDAVTIEVTGSGLDGSKDRVMLIEGNAQCGRATISPRVVVPSYLDNMTFFPAPAPR
jgi:hypothetical protein